MSNSLEREVGTVVDTMPNLLFRVKMEKDGRDLVCHLNGKMKLNKVKVLIGDMVEVVVDPYKGHATNRIVYRIHNGQNPDRSTKKNRV